MVTIKLNLPDKTVAKVKKILKEKGISAETFFGTAIQDKLDELLNEDAAYLNCWEFMKCGREAGGENAMTLGVCPAYPNHGRRCATVAGTFCEGIIQGTFASKGAQCEACEYYKSKHFDSTVKKKRKTRTKKYV
jgi:hypothetical protein